MCETTMKNKKNSFHSKDVILFAKHVYLARFHEIQCKVSTIYYFLNFNNTLIIKIGVLEKKIDERIKHSAKIFKYEFKLKTFTVCEYFAMVYTK